MLVAPEPSRTLILDFEPPVCAVATMNWRCRCWRIVLLHGAGAADGTILPASDVYSLGVIVLEMLTENARDGRCLRSVVSQ